MSAQIRCDECNTIAMVPTDTIGETLKQHNNRRHDGKAVAYVDSESIPLGRND